MAIKKAESARLAEFIAMSRPVWPTAAILLLTALALWRAPALPESFSGLEGAGPYATLGSALVLAWWFNRGRSFVVVAAFLLGWSAWHAHPGRSLYTALVVLVPLNCLVALVGPERGARYGTGVRWAIAFAAQALLLAWLGPKLPAALVSSWAFRSPPMPLVARIALAAALGAAIWRAYPEHRPLQVANAGALVAFFIGAQGAADAHVFAASMSAAGAMLVVALLQESHRLAFRDELTGLLGRRALEERLRSLGEHYAVAMVDVDHFKKFNDTHGHEVGDQVLKLVAGRLAQVGGGGTAYRYGGEEFAVLFPERALDEVMAPLEALRGAIERYRMAMRGEDRPKNPDDTQKLRGKRPARKSLSVTVSIGVAQSRAGATPAQVLKAADAALYRAKQAGRNRVGS